jgi:transcriptional regulator with XRE-family HTH domain
MSETAEKQLSLREKRKLVREFREQNHLTFAEVGKLSGLAESTIYRFEKADLNLSEEGWGQLIDAMHKYMVEKNANLRAEIDARKALNEKLKVRDAADEATASLIEGVFPGGPMGQWLADTLYPSRPGAFERYKKMHEGFQARFGTEGEVVLKELARLRAELKEQRELVARLQAELTKSNIENAALKDWLDAEMVAAIAQEKALELRTRVHEEEARQMQAPEQPAERPLSVRLYEAVLSGREITLEEHEQARASSKIVKTLKEKTKDK